jgi:diguanylate cyclase (GGDEF)-like protein
MTGFTLPFWSLPELITACFCWATWFLGLSLKSHEPKFAAIIRSYRMVTFAVNVLLTLLFLLHSGLGPARETIWWFYLLLSILPPLGLRFSRRARGQAMVPIEVLYHLASLACVIGLLLAPNAFFASGWINAFGVYQVRTLAPGVFESFVQIAAITWSVSGRLGKGSRKQIGGFRWITISWVIYCIMAALEQGNAAGWLALPPMFWIGMLMLTLEFGRLMHMHQGSLVLALGQSNANFQQLTDDLESRVFERTQALHLLAMFDPLTGLANRAHGKEFLEDALSRAERDQTVLTLLLVDLNKFKNINDTVGHQVGDAVLVQVAQRFQTVVPVGGLLVRLGGDEFMLILTESDQHESDQTESDQHESDQHEPDQHESDQSESPSDSAQAEQLSKAMLETLTTAISVNGTEFFVGASIGISSYPKDANDVSSLMRLADLAMYQAKNEQLGYRHYDTALNATNSKRLEIEQVLRQAIENGPESSFRLEYQPIVELHSRRITGFEALLRWNNATFDLGPDQFVPIAEESRMIVPLGTWVLFEACRQAAAWEREGFEAGRVAVNISIHQFERPDFVDTIKRALSSSGLPAHRLTLEFVESIMMNQFEDSAAKIVQLQLLGVLVALDDFGTGYSSLSYLQHLTFDALKIDRSFTKMLGLTSRPRALIAAALGIAHEFKMITVVEGVETLEQAQELEMLGCVFAQGYLFSKPLRAAQATQLLRDGKMDFARTSSS